MEDVTPAPKGLALEHFTPMPEVSQDPPKPNYAELSKAVERRLRIEDMVSQQVRQVAGVLGKRRAAGGKGLQSREQGAGRRLSSALLSGA